MLQFRIDSDVVGLGDGDVLVEGHEPILPVIARVADFVGLEKYLMSISLQKAVFYVPSKSPIDILQPKCYREGLAEY